MYRCSPLYSFPCIPVILYLSDKLEREKHEGLYNVTWKEKSQQDLLSDTNGRDGKTICSSEQGLSNQ
jgi:hypothetical protein